MFVCQTVLLVSCGIVVNCVERANLLAHLYVMFSCVLSLYRWCLGLNVFIACIDSWSLASSLLNNLAAEASKI